MCVHVCVHVHVYIDACVLVYIFKCLSVSSGIAGYDWGSSAAKLVGSQTEAFKRLEFVREVSSYRQRKTQVLF